MIKQFLIFLFLLFIANNLLAKNNKQNFIEIYGNLPLNKININGLKKTSKKLILDEINITSGEVISNFNDEEFLSSIYKIGNFSDISINYTKNPNNTVDIDIKLTDKQTLIPLPIVSSSSNSSTFGLFLLDTNFLGLNRVFVIGGAISSNGNMASLIYANPKIFDSDFGFAIIGAIESNNVKLSDLYLGNVLLEYKMKTQTGAFSLIYNPIKDVLQFNLKTKYTKFSIDQDVIKKEAESFNEAIEIKLDLKTYGEYFSYGFDSNIEYGITDYKEYHDSKKLSNLDSDFSYTTTIFPKSDLMFKINGAGNFKSNNTPLILQEAKGGSTVTLMSLVDTLPIKNNISGSLALEKPIYYTTWGAITVKSFYELGLFTNTLDYKDYTRYSGAGVGTYLYLKKVKFPAVGINITNNFRTGEINSLFTVGFSF